MHSLTPVDRIMEPVPRVVIEVSAPSAAPQPERISDGREGPRDDDTRRNDTPTALPEKVDIPPMADAPGAPKEPAPSPADRPEGKSLTPDSENLNKILTPVQSEPAPQASIRPKMQHVARGPGRQRKYHQTIALLEAYHDGDTQQFDQLDPQMQRYYRRGYEEYFGRASAASAKKRLANRSKAARTKRDAERREIAKISRSIQGIPDHGSEALDLQHAGA